MPPNQAAANAGIAALYADYGLSSYVIGTVDHSYNQYNHYLGNSDGLGDIVVNSHSYDIPILSNVAAANYAGLLAITWSSYSISGAVDNNSQHYSVISPEDKQIAIDLLKNNEKFNDFHLNGLDIISEILKSIANDTVVFTDRLATADAQTDTIGHIIYISNSYKSDPVGLALVLAHEGLHQSLFNVFSVHENSIYEEALGRFVSAYAFSGLSPEQVAIFKNDSIEFNDLVNVKNLSDHGDFNGIMKYVKLFYGGLSDYPAGDVYNVTKGSFP